MKPRKPKVAIIGVGLLGGSLALAFKKRGGMSLVGWNHRASSRRKAAKILPVVPTFEKAVQGADVVVLCAHSGSIGPVLNQIAPLLKTGALVMDVSSVKGEVVREAGKIKGMNRFFVPCHPMAGKEKSGPAFADGNLYHDRYVFITPLPGTPPKLIARARKFWEKVGAMTIVIAARTHDRNVALTSHLPHLLASTLMHLYDGRKNSPNLHQSVGTGFKDFTRIAAGSPAMWADIMKLNATEMKSILSLYRRKLAQLEGQLRKGGRGGWVSFFEKARAARERLS
ncbi:MAG TPA: prephenate dehydrogenase [bacterium]|nr:prephenate dehydrogenase [bacterium]